MMILPGVALSVLDLPVSVPSSAVVSRQLHFPPPAGDGRLSSLTGGNQPLTGRYHAPNIKLARPSCPSA